MNTTSLPQLTRGTALIISGAQGTGKTQLALAIAGQYGTYEQVDPASIETRRGLAEAMRNAPRTLIVEGEPVAGWFDKHIKALITNDSLMVKKLHGPFTRMATPHFIFCTSLPLPEAIRGSRRFHVINL